MLPPPPPVGEYVGRLPTPPPTGGPLPTGGMLGGRSPPPTGGRLPPPTGGPLPTGGMLGGGSPPPTGGRLPPPTGGVGKGVKGGGLREGGPPYAGVSRCSWYIQP
jgi:formin 2